MNCKKIILSMLFVCICVFSACDTSEPVNVVEPEIILIEPETVTETVEAEPEFEEYTIQLMALGDNLIHMGIVHSGTQEDGTRDYSFMFENMEPFLQESEIKVINQETVMAGNELGFSGFPHFNSPTEIGDAIAGAGFNVVLQASNHSADQGLEGIYACDSFWDKYPDMAMLGIYGREEEKETIQYMEIEGVRFALLNYTYGPNYETLIPGLAEKMDILCDYNKETGLMDYTTLNPQVIADIEEAEQNAEIVIVFPHWGTEYTTTPSSYQEIFATQMAEAGANLIIGTHPHVVQPVEWIQAANGNRCLCYYSLGNYVSTQKDGISMLEAMAWVNFRVAKDSVYIQEENTGVIPLVCHYTSGPVRLENVYLLEDYTEEQAARHGIINYGGVAFNREDLQKWSDEILGEWVLDATDVLGN